MTATTVEAKRLNLVRMPDEGQAEADAIKARYGKGDKPLTEKQEAILERIRTADVDTEDDPFQASGVGSRHDLFDDEEEDGDAALTHADGENEPEGAGPVDEVVKAAKATADTKLVQATLTLSPPQVFADDAKWQRSPAIAAAAREIAMSESMAANGGTFAAFWRAKGGTSKGNPVLGGVKLTSGMEKEVTGLDFYIWLAADHLKNASENQIRAQIYHQLAHIAASEETGGFGIRDHDWSGFSREVELFGVTSYGLSRAKLVLEQAALKLS